MHSQPWLSLALPKSQVVITYMLVALRKTYHLFSNHSFTEGTPTANVETLVPSLPSCIHSCSEYDTPCSCLLTVEALFSVPLQPHSLSKDLKVHN